MIATKRLKEISIGIALVFLANMLIRKLSASINLTSSLPLFLVIIIPVAVFFFYKKFPEKAENFFEKDTVKKIIQTILLAIAYAMFFWICYSWLTWKLVKITGTISYHQSITIVTILQLSIAGVIYYLFSVIYPTRGQIGKGFTILSLVGPLVIGYVVYQTPYKLFSHTNGDGVSSVSQFWVSDSEKRIYYSAGYGIEDGKPLRKGTLLDIKMFKEQNKSLKEQIAEFFEEEPKTKKKKRKIKKSLPPGVEKFKFVIPSGQTVEHGIPWHQRENGNTKLEKALFTLYDRVDVDTTCGDYRKLVLENEKNRKRGKDRIRMKRRSQTFFIRTLTEKDRNWVRLTNDGPDVICANVIIHERR